MAKEAGLIFSREPLRDKEREAVVGAKGYWIGFIHRHAEQRPMIAPEADDAHIQAIIELENEGYVAFDAVTNSYSLTGRGISLYHRLKTR